MISLPVLPILTGILTLSLGVIARYDVLTACFIFLISPPLAVGGNDHCRAFLVAIRLDTCKAILIIGLGKALGGKHRVWKINAH